MFQNMPVMYGAKPYLGDLDADGDLDLVAGVETTYTLKHIENVGTSSSADWTYHGAIEGILLDGSCPFAALRDIDSDGDLDLVGLKSGGCVACWENTGTPLAFSFLENPAMLTGVDTEPPGGIGLDLLDIDADDDLDLLVAVWGGNHVFINESYTAVQAATWGRIKALYR
jgi:hypothetical protein